ncbi:MAG: TonB-dependent receptor [Bacteroidota bacterium]
MRRIVFFFSLFVCFILHSQNKYDVDFTNSSLHDAVKELSRKHKFKFSYNPNALKSHSINKRIKAASEAELLSELFEGFPFKIQLSDGVYLLIPQKSKFKPTRLAGKINDSVTGKPLAFAHVQVNNKGTISDQRGEFSLPPREDTLTLQISYIGYKPIELEIPPAQDHIVLSLEQEPTVLQEVILNSKEFNELVGKPGFFSMNPDQFDALPTLGETDVFKSIQLLPGIRATDESSSGLAVRGGHPSQNLVLMDGFNLYHLDHLFGIFSTINPNVINNVNVYKGGFGAEYGGRTSSVVDVAGKAGSLDRLAGGFGINTLSVNGYIETPLSSKTSLLLGARKALTDVLETNLYKDFLSSSRDGFLESVSSDVVGLDLFPSIDFYDFNGKIQHQFSERSVLDVNLFLSEDFYSGDFEEGDEFSEYRINDQANWSNIGTSLSWKKMFSDTWKGDFTLSASSYSDDGSLSINEQFFNEVAFNIDTIEANSVVEFFNYDVESSVSDLTFRSNHEVTMGKNNLLSVGTEWNAISTFYQSDQLFFEDFSTENTLVSDTLDVSTDILSFYGDYEINTGKVTSGIGIRTSFYEPSDRWYFEPRFDVRYAVSENFHLKGAASYHHQFVNQTSLSFFENSDEFFWVLSDGDQIPVQESMHLIFGADFSFDGWTFDVEYYQKNTTGILERQFFNLVPSTLELSQNEASDFSGENTSKGLDLFAKYRGKRFTSWLSYSLSKSENQFWFLNENVHYSSALDQRNEINLATIFKLGKWELSGILIYGSGRPFTPPAEDPESDLLYDLDRINQERLPDYSRIDLSAKYSFSIGKASGELGITLFNMLDRRNIKSRRFVRQFIFDESSTQDSIEEDQVRIVSIDTNLLGFTPNFFFNIRF